LGSLFTSFIIDEELTFIHPDDVELYNKWDGKAFELQVANHELLGHGSGKQFEEYADGTKNFDPEKVRVATSSPVYERSTYSIHRRSLTLSLGSPCALSWSPSHLTL